ncbi:MAG: hypothetical protein ABIE42_00555 [Candidatus Eisenbacteria bacterium]
MLATAPHDTIVVAPGIRFVNLEWPATPGIKLLSESGPHTTILDGRDDIQVIGIYTGPDEQKPPAPVSWSAIKATCR